MHWWEQPDLSTRTAGTREHLKKVLVSFHKMNFKFAESSQLYIDQDREQTSNCICKGPLASFWSNSTTQPISQLTCTAAQGKNTRSSVEKVKIISCCGCEEFSGKSSFLTSSVGCATWSQEPGLPPDWHPLPQEGWPKRCLHLLSRGKCRNWGKTMPWKL